MFTKKYKQDVNDDLSVCVDERRPSFVWIFLDLMIIR